MARQRKKRERKRGIEEAGSNKPETEEAGSSRPEIEDADRGETETDKTTSDQTGIDLTLILMLFSVGCAILVLAWHVLHNVLHVL